jgi:hypothetical protein
VLRREPTPSRRQAERAGVRARDLPELTPSAWLQVVAIDDKFAEGGEKVIDAFMQQGAVAVMAALAAALPAPAAR